AGPPVAAGAPRPTSTVRAARSSLTRSLGAQAVLGVDRGTGTADALQKLNGTLTGASSADRAGIAWSYVRAHAAALGLSSSDLGGFALADRQVSGRNLLTLGWTQSYRGIPAFDNGLRAALDRSGRLIDVIGTPLHALTLASTTPRLRAAQALGALMANVGAHRAVRVASGPTGARRATRFAGGDSARLVIFGGDGAPRLAWHLTYAASSVANYDAVVDATTGRVLYRDNMTKFASDASVWPNYPGAPSGGVAVSEDLAALGYLAPSATRLIGNNAHVYDDLNDDNTAQPSEEVGPNPATSDFVYAFSPFDVNAGCTDPAFPCAWDPSAPASWHTNQQQNAVQLFWLVNNYHDHLASAPIGFTDFQGDNLVQVNADDGAAAGPSGGPDGAHLNDANMTTPPSGPPKMQMYLFDSPNRAINGGDDAATVYHEYTHGLTARLVTNTDGSGALGSAQSSAMSEGWSDWYAEDFLVRQGYETDNSGTAGEIDIGRYSDITGHATRPQGLDCPVSQTEVAECPSLPRHPGGYTFGDFGTVAGFAEPHADGVIWSQTLWDLRQALIAQAGDEQVGSDHAEQLITDAMRPGLSPPEPSFLQERNAILAADTADFPTPSGGQFHTIIWQVFAARGMGFYAGAADSSDTTPVEDFHLPPTGTDTGTIAGRVTSADTGLPLSGLTVGIGGGMTTAASTDANGAYHLAAPAGTYGKLVASPSAGYDQVVATGVQVSPGDTTTRDFGVTRDWAASAGGATVAQNSDDTGSPFGCGGAALVDQQTGVGWSAYNAGHDPNNPQNGDPTLIIRLPDAITVRSFLADPGNTCGDSTSASTAGYRIETSPTLNPATWTVAMEGTFTPSEAHRQSLLTPTAGTTGVRFVRLTLLSPQSVSSDFVDFSELEVLGGRPNVLPSGHLTVSPSSLAPGGTVTLDAYSFTDPDSAIVGYDWDFDGNGTIDRTTAGPTTSVTYGSAGTYTALVGVRDFRGGSGAASATVAVGSPSTVPPSTVPPSTPGADPVATISRTGSRGKVTLTIVCSRACTTTAGATVTSALKRRYRLEARTVAKLTASPTAAGTRRFTLTLTAKVRSALHRRHVKRLPISIRVTTRDSAGRTGTAARAVTVKL
ncbi:MAG: hypothetical protein JWN32_2980, partial [Solirubrobacterales bacterium]|nr:hypothetical protein [Solirubrobacterales bacterium]